LALSIDLEHFAGPRVRKIPAIAQSWRRNWEQVIPFFAFPAAVRLIIYTTHAIECLCSEVRKAVRGRGHFPSDEAATKLIWLALRNITSKWKNPPISGTRRRPFRDTVRRSFCDDPRMISTKRLTHRNSYPSGSLAEPALNRHFASLWLSQRYAKAVRACIVDASP